MNQTNFGAFVERVCQTLERISCNEPHRIAACKTGEEFELCVVEAVRATMDELGMAAQIHYTQGGHAFPDLVIEFEDGDQYGIEVKSSSSATSKNWKINGNSVLGSTKEEVIDTYIIFGKTAIGNQGVRFKRYEDAVANVAVTHSPRYTIDMDLSPEETFFAKSGLSYQQICAAPKPIELITEYFKAQGQQAWWLAESSPAAIRMFTDLSDKEQTELIGYCFVHFPEVFSNSQQKFRRSAIWLAMNRSVVAPSLRDSFTAGGKVTIRLGAVTYERLPQIFHNLRNYRKAFMEEMQTASVQELKADWDTQGEIENTLEGKVAAWMERAAQQFSEESVNGADKKKLLSDLLLA